MELGTLRTSEFVIQGQLREFLEAASMKYKTEVGSDHVLMGWMVRHCASVRKQLSSEGNRDNASSFFPGQGCAWDETILKMAPNRI